jgi:hypothetical protein
LDLLNPEYNLAKDPTAPLSGCKHSEKTKQIMSDAAKKIYNSGRFKTGKNNPNFGQTLNEETRDKISFSMPSRIKVEVTDLERDIITIYNSIRAAVAALNTDIKTILRREKNQITKPYRGRYIIKILRN